MLILKPKVEEYPLVLITIKRHRHITNICYHHKKTQAYNEYLKILNDKGHPLWKEIEMKIAQQSPDLVGISVLTPAYGAALNVAELVKGLDRDIPVVFGGVHPTVLPEESIKSENVNIVVRGEGEYTFLDLVNSVSYNGNLSDVRGITCKEGEKIIYNPDRQLIQNLDELPYPARHLLIDKEKYSPDAFGSIFATRGCPYHCIFCGSHNIFGRIVRKRSPENIVEEIKHIQKTFKTRNFKFEDDCFTIEKDFVDAVCNLIIEEKLDIKWGCQTRVNFISNEMIRKMKAAGCEMVSIGIESGDAGTLKRIKKGITLEHALKAKEILKNNRMNFQTFFMFGFPWETEKEIDRTVSFMKKMDPLFSNIAVAAPLPGTELYDICKTEGLVPENMDWCRFLFESPDMFFTKNFAREEAAKIIYETEKIFDEYNKKKLRKMLISNPSYVYRRIREGKYYKIKSLWDLFRSLW
jgi:magnesium-protoporphyrin IX monomethyl ester (oxidative) cyclase